MLALKPSVAIGLFVGLLASPAVATPWGPFRSERAPVTVEARAEAVKSSPLPSADPMRFAFLVYQRTLSSQDGARCLHHPTCSLYGLRMVRRHRVLGFFLTADRVWRGHLSSPLRPMPQTTVHQTRRFYDPIDASDFFLRGIDAERMPELVPPRPRQ